LAGARHRVYRPTAAAVGGVPSPSNETATAAMTAVEIDGRLRLCPYYFVVAGQTRLSGALATFCPPDKKSSTARKTPPCSRAGRFKQKSPTTFWLFWQLKLTSAGPRVASAEWPLHRSIFN